MHITSRCICMTSLSCERKGGTREGLICKCGEVCGYLFLKIAIVSFLSVRYKSDGLYCRMAGTPLSPTLFFYKSRDRETRLECEKPTLATHVRSGAGRQPSSSFHHFLHSFGGIRRARRVFLRHNSHLGGPCYLLSLRWFPLKRKG